MLISQWYKIASLFLLLILTVKGDGCEDDQDGCSICVHSNWCWSCKAGWSLDVVNGSCFQCPVGCRECQSTSICIYCFWGFILDPVDKICECTNGRNINILSQSCDACMVQFCQNCDGDLSVCRECYIGFTVGVGDNICERCIDLNCLKCQKYNPVKCLSCSFYYLPNILGVCIYYGSSSSCTSQCSNPLATCNNCFSEYQENKNNCSSCGPCLPAFPACRTDCLNCLINKYQSGLCFLGYGLSNIRAIDNTIYFYDIFTCFACKDPNCYYCQSNYQICNACIQGFGVQSGYCVPCFHLNCLICDSNSNICNTCIKGFAVSNSLCVACIDINCSYCLNVNNCLICKDPYGARNGDCVPCSIAHFCDTCFRNSSISCTSCLVGYYLLQGSFECEICPSNCTQCSYDLNSSMPSCSSCITDFVLNSSFPTVCIEKCDYGALNYYCSFPVGIEWDGCSDFCQIQAGFVCSTKFVCSYSGPISLSLAKISRDFLSNQLIIQTNVFPPLHVFTEKELLLKIFKISPNLLLNSAIFDPLTSRITFKTEILDDLAVSPNLTIDLLPSLSSDDRYLNTVTNTYIFSNVIFPAHLPYFYTPMSFLTAELTFYLSYVSLVVAWIALIVGLVLKRLAGLEAMGVLQFSFFSTVWLNSYLHPCLQRISPLKYSNGFNMDFDKSSASFAYSPPFTMQFSLSFGFSNNLNFMLLFQLIPIILVFVSILRVKLYLKNHQEQVHNKNGKSAELKTLEYYVQICFQSLLYFTTFNLLNLVCSSYTFFKNYSASIPSLILFSFSFLSTLLLLIKYFFDPDPFGYFRYSFRYTAKSCFYELAFKHHLVLWSCIIITFVLCITIPNNPFIPLGLMIVFFIFTIIFHPYKEKIENFRSAFNILALCSVIGIRVFLSFHSLPLHNSNTFNALVILTFCVFIPCVSIAALVSLIYHHIFLKYIKPNMELNDEYEIEKKEKAKVYEMLDQINVSQKLMEMQNYENIFMNVGKPRQNLFQYSNKLYIESLESQKSIFEWSKQKKDNSLGMKKVTKLKIDKLCDMNKNEMNETNNKILQNQNIEKNRIYSKKQSKNEKTAKEILGQQNIYMNLKFSEEQNKEFGVSKNQTEYLQAYEIINTLAQSILKQQ